MDRIRSTADPLSREARGRDGPGHSSAVASTSARARNDLPRSRSRSRSCCSIYSETIIAVDDDIAHDTDIDEAELALAPGQPRT